MPHADPAESWTVPDEAAIAGVLALALACGWLLLPWRGERFEWGQYLLVGGLVPVGTLLLGSRRADGWAQWTCGAIGVAALVSYAIGTRRWIAIPLGLTQGLLVALIARRRPRPGDMLAGVAAWAALTALTTSDRLATLMAPKGPGAFAGAVVAMTVVAVSMAYRDRWVRAAWARRTVVAGAIALLALESFRVDGLFDLASIHHWSPLVGPADLVRQGGWLLWDTPAQYGFFSTLAIAGAPRRSVWDAFFLVEALSCTVSAALSFLLLRRCVGTVVSLFVTLAAVLWLPGIHFPSSGGGVHVTPAAGPFRFVWCQALLALAASRPRGAAALAAGTLLWLAGSLWSAESAIYCACTWLPAYVLLVWPRGGMARLCWLALPGALAGAALLGVEGWYRTWLGHGPDWSAFVEAVTSAAGGAMARPAAPWGPVGALAMGLWIVASAAAGRVRHARHLDALAPLLAAWGALWSTSSYFVARSAPSNATNLLPMMCLAAAVALREMPAPRGSGVRTAVGALVTAVLVLALATSDAWRQWPQRRWALRVEERRPAMHPDRVDFLRAAGIPPGAPVIHFEPAVPSARPDGPDGRIADRPWLPVVPFTLEFVPDARRELYLTRYAARTRAGGWVIQNAKTAARMKDYGWFFVALARTHRAGPRVQSGPWTATWYEYAGG